MIALMILVLGWAAFASGYIMIRTGSPDDWGVPQGQMRSGAALMAVGFLAGVVGLLTTVLEAVFPT